MVTTAALRSSLSSPLAFPVPRNNCITTYLPSEPATTSSAATLNPSHACSQVRQLALTSAMPVYSPDSIASTAFQT
jgi:hypothetical protein